MGALSSLATVGLNLALAQQANRRQSRAIEAGRDQDIRAIQERDAEERRQTQEELRRRLAAERARAAAAGVGGRGGSSEAVLRGLVEETEAELRARERASARQIGELRTTARRAQRRNLLELAGEASQSGLRLLGGTTSRRRSLLDL